ncbi:C6 transcription factor [Aspergillus sclerotiicarbonarius CBS 121057]|uniref:C6 transcription factor n=1 Tax=Aspergillus sclerotiicarbonarius (strain CBS 121057 / IBT 28362) TaxID=1448318 RepID=A0A319ESL3_ASPSB|nr:C6 transcription factor [Aspergillus sclerotiicarbonarius CBS 121057]
MVYRGRPSKSCRECRRRDIKCDKKKDACSQCARAGLSCSGYQNPTDLIILDETPTTAEKVLRGRSLQRQSSPDPLSTRLLPTVLQRAKYLYISQYVEDKPATSLFSYMQVFYPSKSDDFPLLETVINAVFMATFSSLQGCQPALYHAQVGYGSALSLTRKAIQSPKEALLDRTLFSILLMSVFERMANSERQGFNLRNRHLQGAFELMSFRDKGQFTDEGGITMFLHLTELVVLDCLANEVDIPPRFLSLRQKALENGADTSSLRWRFLDLMLQYAQLECSASSTAAVEDAIYRAKTLDKHLDQLSKHLPSFISRRQSPEPPNTSATRSDIYPDYNTQRCWNNIRVVRIQLARIIREQYARILGKTNDDSSIMGELHNSNQRAVSLSSDICLSVPCKGTRGRLPYRITSIQSSTLLFHLYVAKDMFSGPAESRLSIPERLQYLKERQPPSRHKSWDDLLYDSHKMPQNVWEVWLRIGREDYSI